MQKGPKCIQTLWDHQKKIPFVEKYKENAVCAILREKTSFWGHTQRLKKVLLVLRCAKNAPQRPQKMQIPRAYQKKSLLCRKSAILSIRWKFQFWEGWGGSLKKVLILVQRPQHKSTSDPVGAPKNNQFGAILIEFGDTKKCCTFSGLELVPKSRRKLIGALSCMHKAPKCIKFCDFFLFFIM